MARCESLRQAFSPDLHATNPIKNALATEAAPGQAVQTQSHRLSNVAVRTAPRSVRKLFRLCVRQVPAKGDDGILAFAFVSYVSPNPMQADAAAIPVRLDLWLWAARFFRTRSLAKQAIDNGKVDVAGQRAKASRPVRVGDAMRIARGDEVFEIVVAGLRERRGPASVAQTLYTESEESKAKRLETIAALRAGRAGYQPPESKPDKRARRLIRALGDIDAI